MSEFYSISSGIDLLKKDLSKPIRVFHLNLNSGIVSVVGLWLGNRPDEFGFIEVGAPLKISHLNSSQSIVSTPIFHGDMFRTKIHSSVIAIISHPSDELKSTYMDYLNSIIDGSFFITEEEDEEMSDFSLFWDEKDESVTKN